MVSKIKSEGYDFAEIVPYLLGEDARKIDWKSTAKTGEPHIKVFYEEKEVNIVICALMSGSLLFEKKKETLLELVASLGYMSLKTDNILTPIMIAQKENYFFPPSKKPHAVEHFIKKLDETPLLKSTLDTKNIATEINRHLKKKSLIIMLGDFLGEYDLSKLSFRHQIHAIMIRDTFEENPSILGEGAFVDPESGEEATFYFGKKARDAYATHYLENDTKLIKHFHALGISYQKLITT